ncbi:MAG: ZIP family metal transporter [Thermoanaerobaculaceae bacterium]|nr:ZIP family metal transporter [Thermoanaerobaculaceae bacterium]MDI9622570.1 ZIP family metal transporter [Acidobacteriota bacterium]NLH09891.1 ZIP family metal transporter [Holophagae bacterium]HPW56957.1 ZIP family metal transporter [Thermoanaerobaculaceae bacterium]
MLWLALLAVLVVAAATLAGGALPLWFDRHSRVFLGFSAGTLVGLALLELIPEGSEAVPLDVHPEMLIVLGAFLTTMLLDKLHVLHPHSHGTDVTCLGHEPRPLAMHGAVGLLIHSAVDGLALAAACRQSLGTAVAVTIALSAHKLTDGITTVSLVLSHRHARRQAVRLLLGNAACLVLGFALGMLVELGQEGLGMLLLVMAGFFLYLGASDLLPSVTAARCRKRDVLATALGMGAIALASALAH